MLFMKKYFTRLLFAGLLLLFAMPNVFAQNSTYWLRGHLRDGFTNSAIKDAKVYLLNTDSVVLDSVPVRGENFSFRLKRDKTFKSCIIRVSHPDYQTYHGTYSLKAVGKGAYLDIDPIFIKRRNTLTEQTLNEVTVTASKVKMYYRGDTLVYNADAFNVANGSMLDALIRQMPGTELTKNGEIFVNGKKVDNLLLNGKDFFRGKNHLMLENLPYYTVKEIKVYDKTTEKAMALHDERARREFVMDVNLKKEYSKGYMANVEAGAGTEDAYLARLFGLRFTDAARWAIVGGANNLNMKDYTFSGYANNEGEREGRKDSKLLTTELRNENKRRTNVLTIDVNRRKQNQGADVFEETRHNEGNSFSSTRRSDVGRNIGASLANKYTLKTPLWMESTTSVRFNMQKSESDEKYLESGLDTRQQGLAMLDSLFGKGIALNEPSMLTARRRWMKAKEKEYGVAQDFAFAKNVYAGDIIDLDVGADFAKSTHETNRFNRYLMWYPTPAQNDTDEDIDRPNTQVGVRANASYKTTRLLYYTDLKFFVKYHFNHANEQETITDAISSAIDRQNSYDRQMREHRYVIGANYVYDHKLTDKKIQTRLEITLPLSLVDRSTNYARHTVDTCLHQAPVFLEPTLNFVRKKWIGNVISSVEWEFAASTALSYTLPDATQLITLPVTSDRINIYQGNALLKSPAIWKSMANWRWPLKKNNTYIRQDLTYNRYINRIVNSYRYDSGIYYNTPENVNGTWNLDFNTRGQYFIKKVNFRWSVNTSYRKMKNYISDGAIGIPRIMTNDEFNLSIPLSFMGSYHRKLTYDFFANVDWRKPMGNMTNIDYRNALQYSGGVSVSTPLFAGIELETDIELTKRTGYSNSELNRLQCNWNAKLSRSVFKKKILLSLRAIDMLRQYKSIQYLVNERGIRETHAVSLPSYFIFCATYKFNKQPKKK